MKKQFNVMVEIPAKFAFGPVEKEISKVFGKNESGAGLGFGIRDIDAYYKTKKAAKNAVEKIKNILKAQNIGPSKSKVILTEIGE